LLTLPVFERLELFKGESDAVPAGAGANVTFAWLLALHLLWYLKGADVLPGLPMARIRVIGSI